jgi:4-amino-4-deoxy-L-arabinose transferase-like glycosyltransferase
VKVTLPLALAALALHAATAGRYGYFRDELYFIACAHHMAWGYVDQPPLVAAAAWLAHPFGFALPALRAGPVVAAALAVVVAIAIARELGGGTFAQWMAGALALLLPAYLVLGNTLTTTSFEPLTWTLAIYCTLRLVRSGDRRWWLALAAVFAFGLYGKYSIALLAVALVAGILMTPQRRALATPWFAGAAALTLLLVAPNLLWQSAHGWPMLAVLAGDATHRPALQNGIALDARAFVPNAFAFVVEQFLYTNPFVVPIWVAGIVAPFVLPSLRDARFISLAALTAYVVAIALQAKGYYVAGLYGALVAVGCVWLERLSLPVRRTLAAVAVAGALALAPFGLPLLSAQGLVAYGAALHLDGGGEPHLVQAVFAEEFGWKRLARDVARVYDALPPAQRRDATIYADTYADAGALDFFGPRYGLPPAISSQNSYYLWGTHGASGRVLVAVGATRIAYLRRYYRSVRLVATSFDPYRWIVEGPAPIYVCTDPVAPLSAIWPALRWYGA